MTWWLAHNEVSVGVTHYNVDAICPPGYNGFFRVAIMDLYRFYIY